MLRDWIKRPGEPPTAGAAPPTKRPALPAAPGGGAPSGTTEPTTTTAPAAKPKPKPKAKPRPKVRAPDPAQRRLAGEAGLGPPPTAAAPAWRGEFGALTDDPGAAACWAALAPAADWRAHWRPVAALLADREVVRERRDAWAELWGPADEGRRHPLGVLAPFLWNHAALPRVLRPGHRPWVAALARRLAAATGGGGAAAPGADDDEEDARVDRALVPAVRRVVHWLSGLRHVPTPDLVRALGLRGPRPRPLPPPTVSQDAAAAC